MEDMVVNSLIRLVFLLSEAKDDEMATQHAYALQLMAEASKLWPTVCALDGKRSDRAAGMGDVVSI
jgi:hypothetical protein